MLIYLVLAVLASSLMALGLLMMKSRADSLPQARGSAIVSSLIAWIREPIWIGGVGVHEVDQFPGLGVGHERRVEVDAGGDRQNQAVADDAEEPVLDHAGHAASAGVGSD